MECLEENVDPQIATTEIQWNSPEFGAIYEEHSKAIYYLALRLLSDPALAEDATHDVFLKAFRKMTEFRGESGLRTWLYRITLNHCRNISQTWQRRNIVSAGDEFLQENSSTENNPLQLLETKELGLRIQTALDALTPEYRLLLLLVADEKLSYEQIGALTEQSPDSVRGKLHRARKSFQLHFQKTA